MLLNLLYIYDDNPILSASTEIPSAQSDATFHDDASSSLSQGKTPTESPVTTTPAKPVSKNLKPYIYAGIAIVAILIAAKVLSKK